MSSSTAGAGKLCIMCGVDCTGRPRTKDRQGRYFCQPCYQKALARARSKKVASPAVAVARSPEPRPRPRSAVADDLSALASLEGAAAAAEIGHPCPRCGAEIPHRKTVCKACGHDTRPHTPTPITPKKAAAAAGPGAGGGGAAAMSLPNFLQSPKIVGLIQAGLLLGLFALAKSSAGLFPLYMLVACVYGIGVGLWALVAAFRTSVGTGFLTLCVPFYAFYFVYAKSGNPFLQGSYTVAIISMILLRVSMPAESLPFEDY